MRNVCHHQNADPRITRGRVFCMRRTPEETTAAEVANLHRFLEFYRGNPPKEFEKLFRRIEGRLARIARDSNPLPRVRYGLVDRDRGRNVGIGRPANRVVECYLDACWVHLADAEGHVSGHPLSLVFDEFGEHWPMVKALLSGVNPAALSYAANAFLMGLESKNLTGLAKQLRDEVLLGLERHPDHFDDEDFGSNSVNKNDTKFADELLNAIQDRLGKLMLRTKMVKAALSRSGKKRKAPRRRKPAPVTATPKRRAKELS